MTLVKKTITVHEDEWKYLVKFCQVNGLMLTGFMQDIIYNSVDEIKTTGGYRRRRPFVSVPEEEELDEDAPIQLTNYFD